MGKILLVAIVSMQLLWASNSFFQKTEYLQYNVFVYIDMETKEIFPPDPMLIPTQKLCA